MHVGSFLLVIWLVIGGIAAGQRGDYKGPIGCSSASTVAVTIIAGPLNYVGVNPNINCAVPHPSNQLWRLILTEMPKSLRVPVCAIPSTAINIHIITAGQSVALSDLKLLSAGPSAERAHRVVGREIQPLAAKTLLEPVLDGRLPRRLVVTVHAEPGIVIDRNQLISSPEVRIPGDPQIIDHGRIVQPLRDHHATPPATVIHKDMMPPARLYIRKMPAASYPNFVGKHGHEAVFSPAEVVASLTADTMVPAPDAVILTYQQFLLDELRARGVQPAAGYPIPWGSLWFAGGGARTIAVAGGFGIGAPAATTVLEQLIALGAREFISIGAAGCLQPRYGFGEAVVCTGAIRDEGVSHHYAPAEKFAWPSGTLTRRLTQALTADGTAPRSGLAWTIDAPYRETVAEARSYQAEGVVCVEMEAAALFAVGRYRGVDVAAAFAISDHLLAEDRWTHAFGTPTLRQASIRLLDAALHALLQGQGSP